MISFAETVPFVRTSIVSLSKSMLCSTPGALDSVVCFFDGGIDAVDGNISDGRFGVLVAVCGNVSAAGIDINRPYRALRPVEVADIHIGVKNFNIGRNADVCGRHGTCRILIKGDFLLFGASAVDFDCETFDIKDNFGNVFAYTGNG